MVTVRSFSKPEEAHLFRTRLEAAGIPAYVQDEYMVQMDWLYSNAIGGVRVQVAEEDVEAVEEFLAADQPQPMSREGRVACPSCGSEETEQPQVFRGWVLFMLGIFNIPLPFSRRRWKCQTCRYVFKA